MIFNTKIVGNGGSGTSNPITVPLPVEIKNGTVETINYVATGTPTITNGILTASDSSNYVTTSALTLRHTETWYMHIITGATLGGMLLCSNTYDERVKLYINSDGTLGMWNQPGGSGYYTASSTNKLQANTEYWIKVTTVGVNRRITTWVSTDNKNWESWMINGSYAMDDTVFRLGIARDGNGAFGGSYYLNDFYIVDEDGYEIFRAYIPYSTGEINLYNVSKTPAQATASQTVGYKNNVYVDSLKNIIACKTNVTPTIPTSYLNANSVFYLDDDKVSIRDPYKGLGVTVEKTVEAVTENFNKAGSVSVVDRIASGFTREDKIEMNKKFTPGTSAWEWGVKFTTGSSMSGSQGVFGDNGTDFDIPNLEFSGSTLKIWMSSNGSNWDIANSTNLSGTFLADTTYWVKIIFDKLKYVFYVSTDGETYDTALTIYNSTVIKQSPTRVPAFGVTDYGGGYNPFGGSIDLDECYIKVDGELWWEAYSDINPGYIKVDEGYGYSDETTGYITLNSEISAECPNFVVHSEDFVDSGNKPWTQPTVSSSAVIGGDEFAVAADTTHSGSIYNAFNGTDSWHSSTPLPHWIKMYNPVQICIKSFTCQTSDNYYGHHPIGDWELQYSPDEGTTWTTVASGSNTFTQDNTDYTLDMSSNTTYSSYWRLYITTELGSGGYIQIKKLRIGALESGTSGKVGYPYLIKPTASTTGIVLSGVQNPTAAYAGSTCTPVELNKKVIMDQTVTKILWGEEL